MAFDLLKAVREAAEGAAIQVPAGHYPLRLELLRSVTLVADGAVVLDGQKQGSCLRVSGSRTQARVVGFTFVGGSAQSGGGVFHGEGKLALEGCRFEMNAAPMYGGGGLYTAGELCEVTGCRFFGNTGRQGGAVLVDGLGQLTMRDSLLAQNAAVEGGALRAREAAKVHLLGCTLADNKVLGEKARGSALFLSGTMTRTPKVTLVNCLVLERAPGPALIEQGEHPAQLTVHRSVLSESARSVAGDNRFTHAHCFATQGEPYSLREGSPAIGAADATAYGAGAKDILGRERVRAGEADAGAFAAG
jgi:hypothetical protein